MEAVKASTSRSSSSNPRLSLEDPIETDWDLGHRLGRLWAQLRHAGDCEVDVAVVRWTLGRWRIGSLFWGGG
eukprot:s3512_g1.t1